jgi:integrase
LEDQLLAGARWQEHGLVFTTRYGTPISPRNLVRSFKALLQRAGLPDMRFHDLRHSCASLLAAQGVPARVAMEVLGHASIQTTQNIYTHVFDDAKRQAADVMERLFGDNVTDLDKAV